MKAVVSSKQEGSGLPKGLPCYPKKHGLASQHILWLHINSHYPERGIKDRQNNGQICSEVDLSTSADVHSDKPLAQCLSPTGFKTERVMSRPLSVAHCC
ncbi:hypothetical protein L1049_019218 [Liquidambar formosana]|uniref:Uncharacterized protein n=1 Tax=Liquidambar formosana TaxID=63359 RepID=A0AAP0WN78_LIQFO